MAVAWHEGVQCRTESLLMLCFGAMTGYWGCMRRADTYSGVLLLVLVGRCWQSARQVPGPSRVTRVGESTRVLVESVLERLRRVWEDREVLRSWELVVGEKVSS